MPRTVILPDPDPTTTIGTNLQFARTGPGIGGILIRYNVPTDPDGTFEITAASLSAAERTALQTVHTAVVALFRAARGYT